MSQADRPDFSVNFDLTAGEDLAPIDIFGAQDSWLFVLLVFEDGDVEGLVELDQHARVKADILIIALKFE